GAAAAHWGPLAGPSAFLAAPRGEGRAGGLLAAACAELPRAPGSVRRAAEADRWFGASPPSLPTSFGGHEPAAAQTPEQALSHAKMGLWTTCVAFSAATAHFLSVWVTYKVELDHKHHREHELELEQGRHLDDPHHRRHLRRHLKKEEAKHAAMKWTLQQAEETRRARAGHEAPGPGVTAA
ncbi:unnamed protein product, partial [Prorocentrum cordatum]